MSHQKEVKLPCRQEYSALSRLFLKAFQSGSELSCTKSFSGVVWILKIALHVFLLVVFAACLVVHKGSLVLVTSTIAHLYENATNPAVHDIKAVRRPLDALITLIVASICIPHIITFTADLYKALPGCPQRPSLSSTLLIFFFETIQTLSTCAIVFLVLPEMDMVRALCVMELVAFLPGFFKLLLCWGPGYVKELHGATSARDHRPKSASSPTDACTPSVQKTYISYKAQTGLFYFFNALALLGQMTGLVMAGWENFELNPASGQAAANRSVDDSAVGAALNGGASGQVYAEDRPRTALYQWLLPVCLFTKSVTWWENFIDADFRYGQRVLVPFRRWKAHMYELRRKITVFTSLWNVGVVIAFPWIASGLSLPLFRNFAYSVPAVRTALSQENVYLLPVLVNALSAFCGFFIGSLACKLFMQKFSFNLPLLMSTPLTVGLIISQCLYGVIPDFTSFKWQCPECIYHADVLMPDSVWQLASCGMFWISLLVITCYLWRPKHNPMDRNDKLFVRPFYDAIFFAQHMMLNRRRRDNELKRNESTNELYFPENDDVTQQRDVGVHASRDCPPMIYACATMWHETKNEMIQLLKSVFRMDEDQRKRFDSRKTDTQYYEYETHIFFDDAFEKKNNVYLPNEYVRQLYNVIDDAASAIHTPFISLDDPTRMVTPYGGRLTWTLPGGTKLVVHLKDKNKIRHKKRWSQCMYMYYLLGYRLVGLREDVPQDNDQDHMEADSTFLGESLFRHLPECVYKKAQNTFILTLDGDVDFKPEAVRMLIDQMKINPRVASVCGRIHPTGDGPVVWFQQFEYAVRHWLQQAAEYIYGCVLCSAGCFSLFRASALMDDNVMRRYCELAEAPREVVQFDQGEDRWLCTLLLQQGHRITYCATADALTYAPESFHEFCNQRRRWMPSTMANIVDLLASCKKTTRVSDYMSYAFIFYQFTLFAVYVLGPGMAVTVAAKALVSLLGVSPGHGYAAAGLPVLLFVFVCFTTEPNTHVVVARLLNVVYSALTAVAVLTAGHAAVSESVDGFDVVILTVVVVFASIILLNGHRTVYLRPALVYLLTFPSTYLMLLLYSLCNLDVVSWGTRERPLEGAVDMQPQEEARDDEGVWSPLERSRLLRAARAIYRTAMGLKHSSSANEAADGTKNSVTADSAKALPPADASESNEPDTTGWFKSGGTGLGRVEELNDKESAFWRILIQVHLHPIQKDREKDSKMESELKSLRNKLVLGFLTLNILWITAVFHLPVIAEVLGQLLLDSSLDMVSRSR